MGKLFLVVVTLFTYSIIFADNIQEVYKRCAMCHGKDGEVPALGKSVVIKNLTKNEFINSLKLYKKSKRNVSGLGGVMQAQVYTLTEEEFERLAEIFKLKEE